MLNSDDFIVYLSIASDAQLKSLDLLIEAKTNSRIFIYCQQQTVPNVPGSNVSYLDKSDESFARISEVEQLLIIAPDFHVPDDRFLNACFSVGTKDVKYLDENGQLRDGKNRNQRSTILLVFPGAILPLSLGSHQRAFNLLYNLKKSGFLVDVLVTLPKNASKKHIKASLGIVCNNVYIYKNNRKKFTEPKSTLRWIEKKWRRMIDRDENLPDLFSERKFTKPTESCKRWVNSLYLANRYNSIIVSYAWMLDCVDYIKPAREEFHLLCDTHDVQYVRNRSLLNRTERPLFSSRREQDLELKMLDSTDAVIAISHADERELKEQLKKSKVITASAGFDYALSKPRPRPPGRPLMFGFIGGRMNANVMSLELILNEWWPTIQQYSPGSKLYIAGSICNADAIQQKIFFSSSVIALGFVNNLADFYSKIDISLNPVLVQGGLNFKSVEAVFAGKRLFTNPLGMECLGKDFPATVIKLPAQIMEFFERWEFDILGDRKQRERDQAKAIENFGNQKSLEKLATFLTGIA